MIVAFCTSSPWASVAAVKDGDVVWSGVRHAPRQASQMCMELLQEMESSTALRVRDADLFCADIGPGSFTGTRVGVILAKTLAFVHGAQVAGATAFDLIDAARTVFLPSRRGEWFVRIPGTEPFKTQDAPPLDAVGFGFEGRNEQPPLAERFALLHGLQPEPPESFLPNYLTEPSISTPNKPYHPNAIS